MQILLFIAVVLIAYLLGSIPFGVIIVRISTGKDVRNVESGRTGGTNVMRAAGLWAGLATALLDGLKGAATVWLARAVIPGNHWLEVLAPVAAILGHNYSIFLIERNTEGRLRLRGGAGGATCVGGSYGLWPGSLLFIIPLGGLIYYFGGYASVATMSAAILSTLIFTIRAAVGASPWEYIFYGLISFVILVWGLRPNIRRLFAGQERVVGWRARRKKQKKQVNAS